MATLMGFMVLASDGTLEFTYGTPALLPALPPLPPLVEIECPKCRGQGYLEHYDPMAHSQRCPECFGRETLQVCSGCLEVPRVEEGLEVCGCVCMTVLDDAVTCQLLHSM